MKTLFTLSCAALLSLGANAQITLTQSSFASWVPGTDSFGLINGSIAASPVANTSVDISGSTYASVFTRTTVAGTNPAFPMGTYGLPFVDIIPSTTNNGITWYSAVVRGLTPTGLMAFGESINRQAYWLMATGNPNDSVVFPAQNTTYFGGRNLLKFPATYNTSWANSYKYTVNFNMTVTAYGLSSAPASRITYANESLSVPGWGKMRVKDRQGNVSGYMNVLAVKGRIDYLDSITLNGSPAPAAMLTAFGLTQAQKTRSFYVSYYRSGELTPLLRVFYTDSNYTTVDRSEVHLTRLSYGTTAVAGLNRSTEVQLYPNPVQPGTALNIQLSEAPTGTWTVELLDAAGRTVMSQPVQFTGGKAQIQPLQTQGLFYYLRLYNDGRLTAVKPVVIVE